MPTDILNDNVADEERALRDKVLKAVEEFEFQTKKVVVSFDVSILKTDEWPDGIRTEDHQAGGA